jgi:hypothetical protein
VLVRISSSKIERRFVIFEDIPYHYRLSRQHWEPLWRAFPLLQLSLRIARESCVRRTEMDESAIPPTYFVANSWIFPLQHEGRRDVDQADRFYTIV